MQENLNRSVEELALLPLRTFRSEATDPATVAEYAGLMERGIEFPPLTIAVIGKTKKEVLVGGAHRLAAATKAKVKDLGVSLVVCKAAVDADTLAFTDNVSHGLSLTAEDKRKAIIELLQVPSFKKLSNAGAAKRLGVSDMTIKRYRDAIGTKSPKASQSGHKNAPRAKGGKSNVAPTTDKGGKTIVATGDVVGWRIAGAMLSGGVDKAADAIVTKVTEGVSEKSTKAWGERIEFIENLAATLTAFADGAKQGLGKC